MNNYTTLLYILYYKLLWNVSLVPPLSLLTFLVAFQSKSLIVSHPMSDCMLQFNGLSLAFQPFLF